MSSKALQSCGWPTEPFRYRWGYVLIGEKQIRKSWSNKGNKPQVSELPLASCKTFHTERSSIYIKIKVQVKRIFI